MSTKISTQDLRNTNIEFEDINEGTMFTEKDDDDVIYIKTPLIYNIDEEEDGDIVALNDVEEKKYNAISLGGGLYWFDPDEIIYPVNEISITIK